MLETLKEKIRKIQKTVKVVTAWVKFRTLVKAREGPKIENKVKRIVSVIVLVTTMLIFIPFVLFYDFMNGRAEEVYYHHKTEGGDGEPN